MTQLTLKTDIDPKKLDALIYFLNSWDIDAEINITPMSNNIVREQPVKNDPFAETRGMWADYDINDRELRRRAWGTDKRLKNDTL
jgi:hypothetical protein